MSFSVTTAATDLLSVIATVPADNWHRTSIGSRTFIIRMTCKRAKDLFRKTGFPVEVRLSESFWNNPSNGTTQRKLQFIIKKLYLLLCFTILQQWMKIIIIYENIYDGFQIK
jgi:hypothetical protein